MCYFVKCAGNLIIKEIIIALPFTTGAITLGLPVVTGLEDELTTVCAAFGDKSTGRTLDCGRAFGVKPVEGGKSYFWI